MPIERIPVVASVDPEANTEVYYESGELSVNTMYDKYSQDRFYATQRPSVKTLASDRGEEREITGWTIDGATYDNVNGTITSETSAPRGVEFKRDGTKMYVISAGIGNGLLQYTLTTPWDPSTESYDSTEYDVDTTGQWGVTFRDDGTRLWVTGVSSSQGIVTQHDLSTVWDVSTASKQATYNASSEIAGLIVQVLFNSDGTKMYLFGRNGPTNDEIHQYSLANAFDISSGVTYDNKSVDVTATIANGRMAGGYLSPNGQDMLLSDSETLYEFSLSTPGDISTASYESISADVSSEDTFMNAIFTRTDEPKLYLSGGNSNSIYQYTIGITDTEGSTPEELLRGRGIYHWEKTQQSYIVINGSLFIDSNSKIGNISEGIRKVFFVETDDYLVILDPENNEGWTISDRNILEKITDEDFPANFATPEQLVGGGAWIDGFLFVLTKEGFIWNSEINDPRSWNALNFLGADRLSDEGVYLSRHAEGLVAIGTRSTEFFYNAGLETGSPLSRRQDLSYYVGSPSRDYVFNTGETVYFIGNEEVGTLGAFTINKYKLDKVSNKTIDTLLTTSFNDKGLDFLVTGAMITNHLLFFVSAVDEGEDNYTAEYSLVFDIFADKWSRYETNILDRGHFPIIGFAGRIRDRTTNSVVLFVNAEYGQMTLDYTVKDFLEGGPYFAEGVDYIEDQEDYVQTLEGDDAVIPFTIRLGEVDFDTMTNKFVYRTEVVGTTLADSQGLDPIQVRWSDDHYNTFSEYRNLDTSFRSKLTRCGNFRRRAHEIHYEGVEPLRIEGIELYLRGSSYA